MRTISMSNLITCIIIDDEPLSLSLLQMYVARVPVLTLSGSYNNAQDAIAIINEKKIDLVITDVRMPDLTGMQLARAICNKCKIIFVSSFPEYAISGFELDVIDYLQKPFSFDRFYLAVQKLLRFFQIPEIVQKPVEKDVLFVKVSGKLIRIDFSKILFVEARKEYVSIITADSKLLTQQSMRQMQELLNGQGFVRVHKSFIVAIDKIDEIERNVIKIQDTYIPIGPSFKEHFSNSIHKSNF